LEKRRPAVAFGRGTDARGVGSQSPAEKDDMQKAISAPSLQRRLKERAAQ
jgi:hypothetical protein